MYNFEIVKDEGFSKYDYEIQLGEAAVFCKIYDNLD